MAPRRSLRQHVAMRDDNSTISSGLSSGAGLVYVMPNKYRNKSQKPTPVEKAQTKQLSKLPLPPPRPKRSRSSRTMSDSSTVASGTTYTSRVSKVSIKPREPVLDPNDPLSKAMQDKIDDNEGKDNKSNALPTVAEASTEISSEEPVSQKASSSSSKKGFAQLPSDESLDGVEEGIPTQVVTSSSDNTVVLPPPPPLDTVETYSLATNDFQKYSESRSSCSSYWRLFVCIGCIILFLVIGGAVTAVLLALKNTSEVGTNDSAVSDNQEVRPPSGSPVLSKPPPTPTLANQPTAALPNNDFAPIFAPIQAPVSNSIPSPNVPDFERLVDLFSDQNEATALALTDSSSAQYRALQWLENDVQQNQFTLATATDRIFQRGALAIFYYSTLGDTQWTTSQGWLDSSSSECMWYGAVCAPDTATLKSLDLLENNLGGSLPIEIGLLVTIESLSLFDNAIGNAIPSDVGKLTLLKHLELDSNGLTGSIPETISELTNLESLALHKNFLTGNIPDIFGFLSVLDSFHAENNNLVGPIPTSITDARELTILALNGNGLTGVLPSEIGLMTRLQEMYLYSNQLSSNLPSELGLLVDCNYMVLAENQFGGTIPDTLGYAENLVGLSLSNNTLTGTVPSTLGYLYDLQFLQVDGNDLSGEVPPEVCALNLAFDVEGAVTADCGGQDPAIECACCTNCPPIWGGADGGR